MGAAGSSSASDDDHDNWFRSSFPESYYNNLTPNQPPSVNNGMVSSMGAAESSSSSGDNNWSSSTYYNNGSSSTNYNNGSSSTYYNNLTPNQPPNVYYGMNNFPNTQFWNYQTYNNSTSPYFGGTFNYCLGCKDYKSGNLIYHPNGSRLCQDCISRTLVDTKKLEGITSKVQKFYEQHGLEFPTDYPILLVDQNEIRRAFKSESLHKGKNISGLTVHVPEEVTCITNYVQNGENIELVKEKIKVERAILLFYDRPEAKIGGTLAHEMMHAYLESIEGCKHLEENTEEGFCTAISHMWFENEAKNNHESYYHNQLVESKIRIETSNAYGNGFKKAKLAIDTYGLRHTLKTLVKKGKFPK